MRRTILAAIMLVLLGNGAGAETGTYFRVFGVADEDMLKMRAKPGVGFRVIVGLPNGTIVRSHGCDPVGTIYWCKVSLKEAPGLMGYVSKSYLQDY